MGGDRQRVLLAVLLLHANEVVWADVLIDGLWGERPPPSALNALHVKVSRLRRALAVNGDSQSDAVLATRGRGYMLRVEPGELDVDRFRSLLEQGREQLVAGDPNQAARTLRSALAMCRGPPLADFSYEPFAQAAIAELEELRLAALEERVEADLALGAHRELIGELTAAVGRNPLRERLRAQLMLALHRCGRQAEALDVYQEFRRTLSEELGLDPGPRLQQLELAILGRDPSLDLSASSATAAGSSAPPPSRAPPDRRRIRLALGGSALLVVVLAVVMIAASVGGRATPSMVTANSVGVIGPADGAIHAVVPLGFSPATLAAGDGALWVTDYEDGTVSRIDPATRAVVDTIPIGSWPTGIAVGAGAVWLANGVGRSVSRIDPAVNRVVQTIPVGSNPNGVAVGDGSVWVANTNSQTLTRVDAVNGAVLDTIALGADATGVATGLGGVWVSDTVDGRVLRVDPQSDQVSQRINVGHGADAITVGKGSVWVANSLDGTVSRIDPQTNAVTATIAVGDGPPRSPSAAAESGSQTNTPARSRTSILPPTRWRAGSRSGTVPPASRSQMAWFGCVLKPRPRATAAAR